MIEKKPNDCCQRCKGCVYRGKYHDSHTEWSEAGEPCRIVRCEAGIITESNLQCYTPCRNPLPPGPGKCCATCPGCRINGQRVTQVNKFQVTLIVVEHCVKYLFYLFYIIGVYIGP